MGNELGSRKALYELQASINLNLSGVLSVRLRFRDLGAEPVKAFDDIRRLGRDAAHRRAADFT